jgi:hypothetical protein
VSTDKEQDDPSKVVSAPPVRSDVLRQNKLRPLSSARTVAATQHPSKAATEDDGEALPADMTDSAETDRAVDVISSTEADEVLAAEDARRDDAEGRIPNHPIRSFFAAWLSTKRGWKWTFLILFVAIVVLAGIPKTRYWMLNAAGVRCSLSFTAVDNDTQLALPGVDAIDGTMHVEANHAGAVSLHNLKLGSQTVKISRPGFATVTEHVVLGWGSNPLGSVTMKDVGQQYTVLVHDYLSGAAVTTASVNNDGLQALADKSGKVTLTVSGNANASEQPVPITISAPGYVSKNMTLSATNTKPVSVTLVTAQKEVFVSNQEGLYNLYSSYVDGTDKQVLLAGTSTETSNIALAMSPDGTIAALVSTRDAKYDSNGNLLQAITLVGVNDGTNLTLDHAEQIKLIGWVGSTIIYEEQTVSGSSPSYSIISYNYATDSRNQLATSSQFTGVILAAGTVYYAIPSQASTTDDGFYAIQPNGSGKQTILTQDIWSILRSGYTDFSLQTANGWYTYTIGSSTASSLSSAPTNLASIQFLDSADGKLSASVVNGQLHVLTVSGSKDQTITAASGAAYPLRWLNSSDLVYRVTNDSGSSDYVIDIYGGAPKLITSLSNTTGIAGN